MTIIRTIHNLAQAMDAAFKIEFEAVGCKTTPRQYEVLRAINECDEPSQTQIVAVTGIDRSTLADILLKLEGRELITRRRKKEDARANILTTTLAGREIVEIGKQIEVRISELVPPQDALAIQRALVNIIQQEAKNAA